MSNLFRVEINNEIECENGPEEFGHVIRLPTAEEAEAMLRSHWAWLSKDSEYYRRQAGEDADNPKFQESSDNSERYYSAWLNIGYYALTLKVYRVDTNITTWAQLTAD